MGQYLTSVTCTGTSNCWAMGSTMDASGNPSTTLAEHWDGSAWTVTPSLNPPTPANIINAVTCIDASDCWATGATNAASGQNQTPTPFIENWNGSAWTVDPSPNVVVFGFLTNRGLSPEHRVLCHRIYGDQCQQQHDVSDADRATSVAARRQSGIVDDRV